MITFCGHRRAVVSARRMRSLQEKTSFWLQFGRQIVCPFWCGVTPWLARSTQAGEGSLLGSFQKTMRLLADEGPLMAVVGPSISLERYEVGEEVVQGIARWTEPKHFVRRGPGKPHVDGGCSRRSADSGWCGQGGSRERLYLG